LAKKKKGQEAAINEEKQNIINIDERSSVAENIQVEDTIQENKETLNEKNVAISEVINDSEMVENKKRVGNITMEKKKRFSGLNKGLAITAIILVILVLVLLAFVLVNKLNDKVYNNIYLNGINIEGKSQTEVNEYLNKLNETLKSNILVIKNGEKEIIQLMPETIDMEIDVLATASKIMAYGRDGNLVENNINIAKAYFKKQNIDIVYCYSESKLANVASEISQQIEGRVIDDSYTVDEAKNELIITRGKQGKDIVIPEFKQDVLDLLKSKEEAIYELKLEDAIPNELDVDVVFTKVSKEAKDAYVDNMVKPAIYHKHELGITFDKEALRLELAKEENKEQGKVIKFALVTVKPQVTIQDITKDLYRDTLGKYVSDYSNSDANRASNVKLAAKMLNGTIIMPGETFSFNKVMGDCGLASRGFKSAAVFKAGKVVQEIGGGVCQISSTLYIAALYANMSIVTRNNHALPVGYVPASLDATVYYPYTDFKFKNTRNYPVKIVATTSATRKLTISICGTKEDVEYEIVLTSQKTGSIAPKVQEQKDSSLAVGKTKVIQSGAYGYTSVAYKTVKLNGKVISKTLLSEDKYGSTPRIIAVGTKQPSVNVYGE